MKKAIVLGLALFATTASAAITGTPHDLLKLAGNTASSACQYCHMPHHSNTAVTDAPLWAKAVRTSYTDGGVAKTVGSNSQLCLSCHDGTASAVTTQHNGQTLATAYTINGGATGGTNVGTELGNDHPVSITYASAGGGLAALVSLTAAKTAGFVFFGATADQLECGSCHDPHVQPTGGNFLRGGTGDFCTKCHQK
ncbi:cytochrome c3 family protein [Anaeromyxobacter terrae]|uniref:cytochrome c3 family protein n=1 Tax=Anaeromyxobacter terrae TaxID=2925406 RepID=UPI001F58DD8B|nr:cytochrome c3 family protein [Anaeromyxobacter sp. SG22]